MPQAFDFKTAVPWGRSFAEYRAFFALDELAPGAKVLDCGAGPSSFSVEAAEQGLSVCAADPLYSVSAGRIARRIEEVRPTMLASIRQAQARFVWDHYGTPEKQEAVRLAAMQRFLADFGSRQRRTEYVAAALPSLPFRDQAFDLALSSHFLLLYSKQFDLAFHLEAIRELLRVARRLRIFPLLDLDGRRSQHLEPLRQALASDGFESEVVRVDYEFQKGGNEMLRVGPSRQ